MSSKILKLKISLLEIETTKDDDGKRIEAGTLRTWEKTHTFLERIIWTPDAFKKIGRLLLYDVFTEMRKEVIRQVAPRPSFIRKSKPKPKLRNVSPSHCTKCGVLLMTFGCRPDFCNFQSYSKREL